MQARLDAAQTQAHTASQSRYWAAYKFPVRPNVSVDAVLMSSTGLGTELSGIIRGNVGEYETRSLGVFLLYEGQELFRVELYNLERERKYEGWPVYWLGEVDAPQSLTLLSSLVGDSTNEAVGGKVVEAIAVHESPEVGEVLVELSRSSPLLTVRAGAVFCLGRFNENLARVEEIAADAVVIGLLVFAVPAWYAFSLQVMTGYVLVLLFVVTPLQVVMTTLPILSRANIAVGRVEGLGLSLTKYAAEERTADRNDLPATWKSLEMREVTHTYRTEEKDESFTLGPIDLSLRPGELVFFIGGNGSGKTTLAKLLLGLYAPESGKILLDGKPITEENRDYYRQMFTAVFSDFYLFDTLLGLESQHLDEHALEYLKQLQLTQKVQVNDGVLSTTKLSQGTT